VIRGTPAAAALGMKLVEGNEPEYMKDLLLSHIEKQGFHVVFEDPDMSLGMKCPRDCKK